MKKDARMDGWKALVMIVAIVAATWLGYYIFDEIKKAKIMEAKAAAMGNVLKGGAGMLQGFIPGNRGN
jgi:divalent metal cation (Fe/Co/Zn/Cd) transporter